MCVWPGGNWPGASSYLHCQKKYLKLRHPDHKVLPHATLLKLKSDKFWKVVLKFEVSGSGGYWSLKCTRHLNNKISISGKQEANSGRYIPRPSIFNQAYV